MIQTPITRTQAKLDPRLIGGLAGAGIGGVAGAIADNKRGSDKDESFLSRNRGMLIGALGGGAAGAAAGHLINKRHNQLIQTNTDKFKGRGDKEIERAKDFYDGARKEAIGHINDKAKESLKKADKRNFWDKTINPFDNDRKRAFRSSREELDKIVKEEVGNVNQQADKLIDISKGNIQDRYQKLYDKAMQRDSKRTKKDIALAGAGLVGAGALGVALTKKKDKEDMKKHSRYFSLGGFVTNHLPEIGALTWAGVGGYLGYKRNRETSNPYRGAVVGALAGGAAGYGLGSVAQVPALRGQYYDIVNGSSSRWIFKTKSISQNDKCR